MTTTAEAIFEPPGRDSWRAPFPMYKALRDHDPVHHNEAGDYWVLSRFEHVHDAAVDWETFSSAQGLTIQYGEKEQTGIEAPIVMLDPPEHTALRQVISKGFTPRKVTSIEPSVREFVVERVEKVRSMGEADVIEELLKPLPSFVVADYLGVPQEDRGLFDRWTDAIVAANADGDVLSAKEAVGEMFEYFNTLIDYRRKNPGDDTVSILVEASDSGDNVNLIKILGFAFTMVTGGNDTTTGLLGGALELMTKNPDQKRKLLEDPSLIPNSVEEFLRLTSPVQGLARMTTRDVEINGRVIPADRKVLLLYGSANRDDREYGPTADECDVEREIKHILTFSVGPHYCLGAAAARLQARIALEELLGRCPNFSVDYDAGRFANGPYVRRYESLPFSVEAH